MAYSLAGLALNSGNYNLQSESCTVDAGLFKTPLPASATSNQVIIDIFGPSKTISIGGVYTDTSVANLASAVTTLLTLNNLSAGTQTKATYISDLVATGGGIQVFIDRLKVSWEAGTANKISFDIDMTEGTS